MSASAQRVLRVLKALQGHSLHGVSNGELAKELGETPTNITRALSDLCDNQMAQKDDDGKYRLGSALVRIARAFADERDRMTARIREYDHNTSRI